MNFSTADERRWTQMKSIITTLYLRSSAFICGLISLSSSVFMLKLTVLGVSPRVPTRVQDKNVILDTNRATMGMQGGAERVRPRG
jgi:hypothetical protein